MTGNHHQQQHQELGLQQQQEERNVLHGEKVRGQNEELSSLTSNESHLQNERRQMERAIKMLAYVTIAQTKKFFLFKRKYLMSKVALIETSHQVRLAEIKKEDAETNFFVARAQFLKEKDIREELSEEVQYLAKKNNKLRNEKNKEIEAKQSILDEIINTWEKFEENPAMSRKEPEPVTSANNAQRGESTHEIESSRIKELESMVSHLSSELKRRDDHLSSIRRRLEESKNIDSF